MTLLYRALRPLLFALDPETAHTLSMGGLDALHALGLARALAGKLPRIPVRALGLEFPNPLGLAAGLDKHGDHIDALGDLGFGFIEIGGVTPRPQPGNPRPRVFRLPEAEAIINRLGFNSLGLDHLVARLEARRSKVILGVNLGKNLDTPIERAADDYIACLRGVYAHADFATVNVSSPNTANLRSLQSADELDSVLAAVAAERERLALEHGRRLPLAVKVAPDLDDAAIEAIADRVIARGMDALIATNTTTGREGIGHLSASSQAGGLSGAPLRAKSTAVIRKFARALGGRVVLIGCGGISSVAHAQEKLDAGAALLQLYAALVYRGPGLPGEIVRGLARAKAGG